MFVASIVGDFYDRGMGVEPNSHVRTTAQHFGSQPLSSQHAHLARDARKKSSKIAARDIHKFLSFLPKYKSTEPVLLSFVLLSYAIRRSRKDDMLINTAQMTKERQAPGLSWDAGTMPNINNALKKRDRRGSNTRPIDELLINQNCNRLLNH
jgi:hypothetical protein